MGENRAEKFRAVALGFDAGEGLGEVVQLLDAGVVEPSWVARGGMVVVVILVNTQRRRRC